LLQSVLRRLSGRSERWQRRQQQLCREMRQRLLLRWLRRRMGVSLVKMQQPQEQLLVMVMMGVRWRLSRAVRSAGAV
jgi:hypothetical protein